MPLLKRSIGENISAARRALSGEAHAGEVARTLELITRLAHQLKPADLALTDARVTRALAELGVSYGFVRLRQAARDVELDHAISELRIDWGEPQSDSDGSTS
ncbi:hypothetical protein EKD04_009510 [Chloroflexales bacterium ZM16-3]|nr:hypothetical protein [Chloroflexales bacterium ZM16-3]